MESTYLPSHPRTWKALLRGKHVFQGPQNVGFHVWKWLKHPIPLSSKNSTNVRRAFRWVCGCVSFLRDPSKLMFSYWFPVLRHPKWGPQKETHQFVSWLHWFSPGRARSGVTQHLGIVASASGVVLYPGEVPSPFWFTGLPSSAL